MQCVNLPQNHQVRLAAARGQQRRRQRIGGGVEMEVEHRARRLRKRQAPPHPPSQVHGRGRHLRPGRRPAGPLQGL